MIDSETGRATHIFLQAGRQIGRQASRQTDGQTADRQTLLGREASRQADKQIGRLTGRHIAREKDE